MMDGMQFGGAVQVEADLLRGVVATMESLIPLEQRARALGADAAVASSVPPAAQESALAAAPPL